MGEVRFRVKIGAFRRWIGLGSERSPGSRPKRFPVIQKEIDRRLQSVHDLGAKYVSRRDSEKLVKIHHFDVQGPKFLNFTCSEKRLS